MLIAKNKKTETSQSKANSLKNQNSLQKHSNDLGNNILKHILGKTLPKSSSSIKLSSSNSAKLKTFTKIPKEEVYSMIKVSI